MNFNSNRENLNHLIAVARADKAEAEMLQNDFNKKRITRIQKAVTTRPLYIRLKFDLKAAGRPAPYSEPTGKSPYNYVILGFITNNSSRLVSIRRPENSQNFAYVGSNVDLRLTLNELAGVADFEGTGQRGIFYLPTPIPIKANDRLTVDVFKPEATDQPETLDVVLIGYQVNPSGFGESLLSATQQELMNANLETQATPEVRFLKQQITFDQTGFARNEETPPTDEPLLIRGVRTTFKNSLVEIGLKSETKWTTTAIPFWAMASYGVTENYRWYERPVFLPEGVPLQMSIENATGDDADAETNEITWICETA